MTAFVDFEENGGLRMLQYKSSVPTLLAPAFFLAMSLGSVKAEEPEKAKKPLVLDEVIVTAQKRSENASDVPISITSLSGDALAARGITNTSQLTKVVSGFVHQTSTFGSPIYYIRGVGFAEITQAVSPAVSIYVDQIPIPVSTMARGAILDLEGVEVLKGPQGTLFGQNATGGAINYIAARPSDEFSTGLNLNFGSFDAIQVGGFVSGSLSETLKARFSARRETRGDWQRSSSRNDEIGERDFTVARILLDWEPSDTLRFGVNLNGWQDKSDSQANQFIGFRFGVPCPGPGRQEACDALLAQPLSPETARAADWTPDRSYAADDRYFQGSLHADWDVTDDVTLTSLTSFADYSSLAPFDTDGMAYKDLTVIGDVDIDTFSQELRAAGELDNGVRWMFGGNYQRVDSSEVQLSDVGSTNSAGFDFLLSRNSQRATTKAAFVSLDVPLGERFKLLGSARYTTEDRDFNGCAEDVDGGLAGLIGVISNLRNGLPPVPPVFIEQGSCVTLSVDTNLPVGGLVFDTLSEDNFSWRASLNYKPDVDSLVYFTASKGYKSGSYPLLPAIFDSQLQPATQESVLAYETGLKKTFADRRVRLNGALYYYDYEDKQVRGFVDVGFPFGNIPVLVNVPKSRAWGVDLELTAIPMEGLQISAGINYIDTEVRGDFNTPDPLGDIYNINGEEFPMAPQWQFNGDIEYRFSVGGSLDAFVGVSPRYQSSTKSAFGTNPLIGVDSYTLLDVRAGVETEDGIWRLEAYGRNVTDEYYWTQVTREIDAVTRLAGMPATYGIRVSYRH